jgi:N-formylglutamate amidohydrolase
MLQSAEPASPKQAPTLGEKMPTTCRTVLHVPHASTHINPADLDLFRVPAEELKRDMGRLTDHFTDELFAPADPKYQTQLRHTVSRFVVDPERFERDADEPMAARGMGVLYQRGTQGQWLRPEISAERRNDLLDRYYRPHHLALEQLVESSLTEFGRALIIDCHSYPDEPLPSDADQTRPRPDLCFGTDAFHTPPEVVQALSEIVKGHGLSVGIDQPYAGTIVPLKFLGTDQRVVSVMIEVNRRLYMELGLGSPVRTGGFDATRSLCMEMVRAVEMAVFG